MIMMGLLYGIVSTNYGNISNAAAGAIIASLFLIATNVPVLADPTPRTRANIIIFLMIYIIIGMLWGNVLVYDYVTTTKVPIRYLRFLNRNTWRIILWPGDLTMFILRAFINRFINLVYINF